MSLGLVIVKKGELVERRPWHSSHNHWLWPWRDNKDRPISRPIVTTIPTGRRTLPTAARARWRTASSWSTPTTSPTSDLDYLQLQFTPWCVLSVFPSEQNTPVLPSWCKPLLWTWNNITLHSAIWLGIYCVWRLTCFLLFSLGRSVGSISNTYVWNMDWSDPLQAEAWHP